MLPVPTSVQHHFAAAGGTAIEVFGTKHRSKRKMTSPSTHWDLLNYMIKGTGSKASDSSDSWVCREEDGNLSQVHTNTLVQARVGQTQRAANMSSQHI